MSAPVVKPKPRDLEPLLADARALLAPAGIAAVLVAPDGREAPLGASPPLARVLFHDAAGLYALLARDHLALAEAYLAGQIDIEGDMAELMKVSDVVELAPGPLERARLALRLVVRDRIRYDAESIAFHYDRPAEFFLPWLGRWRCYSHGLYASERDDLDAAIERKMQAAVEALALEPGQRVLDMGGGWGCFVEYAGQRGIRVHAITISRMQHDFVARLIEQQRLPCSVELVNFREYRPSERFDGAVFMGTFEHNPEYERAAAWLAQHLTPEARVWADFCAQHRDFTIGRFMKRHIWPGPIQYVNPHALCRALMRAGFNVHSLADDTRSYALTIRDWGDRFEAHSAALAARFGEPTVRAFRLFLRGSWHWLSRNQTQAYHLVAGRDSAPLA